MSISVCDSKEKINFDFNTISMYKNKKIYHFIVRIFITMILLLVVFFKVKLPSLQQITNHINWLIVLAIWVTSIVLLWLRSLRNHFILKTIDCDVSIFNLARATSITTLYSLVLPGLLSSGVKWYILKKDTGQGSRILSSMVYNQFSELFIVFVLGMFAVGMANIENNKIIAAASFGFIAIMIIMFLVLVSFKNTKPIRKVLAFPLIFMPKKLRDKADTILDQLHIYQKQPLGFHLKIFGFTILGFLGSVLIYVLSAKALALEIPTAVLAWQCAFIYLLGKLPISIANLGVREVTLIEVLKNYNIEPSSAFLLSMLVFSNLLLIAVLGALFQIFYKSPTEGQSE